MNVLINRHHPDLYWSFDLLAKRMGWTLYIPYGMEWFDKGHFLMHRHDQKRDQFHYMAKHYLVNDIWESKSTVERRGCEDYPKLRTLTFPEFLDTPIDIVICTNRENEDPFYRLKNFKPNLKFVRQVGNRFDTVDGSKYPNVMFSDKESFERNDVPHKILYHQEFDLNLFKPEPITNTRLIYAFQHDLDKYEPAEELWIEHQHQFPEHVFRSFGKSNEGGYIYRKRDYVSKMLEATFVWQVKDWEGYSHVIHNAFALGRPMILRRGDVVGRIFEPLCDETTCVFTDQVERIRNVDLDQMYTNCVNRFHQIVNFDKEALALKRFFEEI